MRTAQDRVVIVGGGVTGTLTAAFLAEAGFRVTLLEKERIGHGASSRSAACIRAQFTVPETVVGMRYSTHWYEHFTENLPTPSDYRQDVITQNGYLFLYEDPEYADPDRRGPVRQAWEAAKGDVAMQQGVGLPVELLLPEDVHRRWPHILPDRICGATFCQTDGFLRHDVIYNQAAEHARALGADIRTRTPAIGVTSAGGRILEVKAPNETFPADWVINSTNAWAPRFCRLIGAMELQIDPLKRYLYFMTPNEPPMSKDEWDHMPMTIYGNGAGRGAYTRPEGEKLLVARGHDTKPEHDFDDEDQDRIEPDFDPSAKGFDNLGYRSLQEVAEFAPDLGNCGGIKHVTCGFYDTTRDHNPFIGIDDNFENLVHAVGFSGHGLMHAPITAHLVRAILTERVGSDGQVLLPSPFNESAIDLRRFAPNWDNRVSVPERNVL